MRLAAELEIEYAVNFMIDGESGENWEGGERRGRDSGRAPPRRPPGHRGGGRRPGVRGAD